MWGALAMGALLPALLTAILARWAPPVWAATLGLASALAWLAGWPGIEPALWEITDWSWGALLLGLILALVPRARLALAGVGWGLLALGALRPLVIYQWTWAESLLWLTLAALSAGAGALAVTRPRRLWWLAPWSLGVALALAATGSLLLGQVALGAAAVACVACWVAREQPAALLPALAVSQLCVMGGLAYASTPLWLGAALLLLPLGLVRR
jgi:hypothetical protein